MAEIFKNIQKNQTVYILDTKALQMKEAQVKDNQPHIGSTYTMGMQAQMMRDVTLESDGRQQTYTIPEQLSVTYAADLVLSTEREALGAEVERMKQAAEQQLVNNRTGVSRRSAAAGFSSSVPSSRRPARQAAPTAAAS